MMEAGQEIPPAFKEIARMKHFGGGGGGQRRYGGGYGRAGGGSSGKPY